MGLFTPDQAFDVVAKNQIEQLRKPCLNIIQLVATELYNIAKTSVIKVEYLVFCPFTVVGVLRLSLFYFFLYLCFACTHIYFFYFFVSLSKLCTEKFLQQYLIITWLLILLQIFFVYYLMKIVAI